MAKVVEMEILKTCPLGGQFKVVLKMILGYTPFRSISKNKFNVPGNQIENIFGLWRQRDRPWPFFFGLLK